MIPSFIDFEDPAAGRTAEELRDLAERLIAMADWIEGRQPANLRRSRPDPARFEEMRPRLQWEAEALYRLRQKRFDYIDSELLGEPGWDILLDLYIQEGRGRRLSVTSACAGSKIPQSTALRWIALLESSGLVCREPSESDRRRWFIGLTERGRQALSACLAVSLAGREQAATPFAGYDGARDLAARAASTG